MIHPERPISLRALQTFCETVLRRVGVGDADAALTADALVTADSWGVHTHGTKLLAGYVKRLKAGGIRADARPHVASSGPAWAILDGEHALGQVSGSQAMDLAVEKAKQTGIAFVGVRNGNHFGAFGYYPWRATRAGLIGIAVGNDIPSVAAPGSRRAVTGTNPLAYGIPVADGDPIILDIATSTVAGGKVYMARTLGKPIPPDWLIDAEGRPTTDGSLYPERAALAPMAGHKGYGIGLLVETLAGVVSGASIMWDIGNWIWGDASAPTRHGAAFLAIDGAAMHPDFARRVQTMIDEVRRAPTAEGVDGVLLPGEREWKHRRHAADLGVLLPEDVRRPLAALAEEFGLELS